MTTPLHERLLSAFGTALVMALLGYLFLVALNTAGPRVERAPTALVNIALPPDPPRKPPQPVRTSHKAGGRPSGGTAKAVAPAPLPKPKIPSFQPPVIATPLPAPTVAPLPAGDAGQSGSGQGTGAGGSGGGNGRGTGSGDGDDVAPRLIRGRLKFSDLPASLRALGVGGVVSVRYAVEADGSVGSCTPVGSSGNAELDQRTCQLIQQRFRFDPARDGQGHRVRSVIEEEHSWEIEHDPDPDRSAPHPR